MRTLPEIQQQLSPSFENGLSLDAVVESRRRFGANQLTPLPREPLWKKFLGKFDEPIIIILLVAALLSMLVDLFKPPVETGRYVAGGIVVGLAAVAIVIVSLLRHKEWVPSLLFLSALILWPIGLATGHASYDGLAVMIAVILATGVAFLSEYKSDREFELLNARKELQVKVIRAGDFHTIPMEEVAVGDLMVLEMGDEVAADGRLVKSTELYIDQSLMTGESEPVHKRPRPLDDTADGPEQPGCLYRGTQVVDGVGQMIVTEIGDATYLGKIARRLSAEEDEEPSEGPALASETGGEEVRVKRKLTISKEATPLQQKLEHLAGLISRVGYVAAVAIFLALVVRGIWVGELRWPRSGAKPDAGSASGLPGAAEVRQLTSKQATALAISSEGRLLAVASDNIVILSDASTGKPIAPIIRVPGTTVYALALSADARQLAVASGDDVLVRTITLWDRTGDEVYRFEGTWDRMLAFRPDLKQLAAVNVTDRALEIWDVAEGKKLRSLKERAQLHTRLVFSPDGKLLATTGLENKQDQVKVWNPATGERVAVFPPQKQLIRDVAFSPDSKHVAESGAGAVVIREADSGKEVLTIRGPEDSYIDNLSYGAEGTRLAAIIMKLPEVRAAVWDTRTGAEVASIVQTHGPLALSPDGRSLLANSSEGQARLWPLEKGAGPAGSPGQSAADEFWPVLLASAGQLLRYFMYMVIIIVVAVPEGLPMSVTVSLALAMRKMTRANSLVRQLVACETIGSATVICSDKTGTLTQNKMQVVRLGWDGQLHDRGTDTWVKPESHLPWPRDGKPVDWIALNSAVNSTANLEEKNGLLLPVGNSTEGSLLQWLHEAGIDYTQLRDQFTPVYQVHFSSERKRMTTVIRHGRGLLVLIKGAPEWVLQQSTHYQAADGTVREWTSEAVEIVLAQLQTSSAQAMRTLAFGHAYLPEDTPTDEDSLHARRDDIESNLVFAGFVAIRDPLRHDVKDAVAECRKAGIDVKMITGDNVETARAIGHEIGLVDSGDAPIDTPDGQILTSQRFNELSDAELKACLPRLRIVARARPLDKFRLVKLLQEQGEVVAVTGDGTNDAPALKKADVGLAMGRSGTEVAKEASKIVLLDDAFSTIVKAVHWGRSLYENIQRFIQFQLTINVSALAIAFLGPLFGVEPPFTILQLLWINVIMDTLASIALCSEPPRAGLMQMPPKRRDESILTRPMMVTLFTTAAFFVVVMMTLLWLMQGSPDKHGWLAGDGPWAVEIDGTRQAVPASELVKNDRGEWTVDGKKAEVNFTVLQVSLFFSIYVFFQVWNEINCRSLAPEVSGFRGLFRNPTFLAIVGLIVVVQVAIVTFGGPIFKVTALGWIDWLAIAAGTASVLLFAEIVRRIRLLNRYSSLSGEPKATAPA